jgi:HD-GYP domain-containing protein (c-di-GMP phosphodiesterase class II)
MVRMSDLVRGIVRESPPAPLPARPERSAEPAEVTPMRLMSLASLGTPPPVEREDPVPPEPEPRVPEPPAESPEPLFGEIQAFLGETQQRLHGSGGFPWGRLQALVDRAISALARSADLFWVANNPAVPAGVDYIAFHQARVCVLALRIGGGVGYDGARLSALGLAAALFDVALWQMPEAILRRVDSLSGEELALWRSHPRLSADIVRRWGPPDEHIAQTILEHHEREQGQGFPQGLHGPAIDPDAKIIALVDTYTALTVPPSSRPRLKPHEAIREIVKTRNDQFPSALVKALLSEISVFPPGTVVRLNTDEVGRVIAVNRHHPLRPKVEILADGKGQRPPAPKMLDLSEAPFLYITGPVGEGGR